MSPIGEPVAAIVEVYDALVAAGVPDREARKAAEALAARSSAPGAAPGGAGAVVEIWRTLLEHQAASVWRLARLRLLGSALVALLVVSAVAVFGSFPDALVLLGPYPVHASVAPLALALLSVAQGAALDRRERRRLAAAQETAERVELRAASLPAPGNVDPRALLGRRGAGRGAGFGADLFYLGEALVVCALLYALVEV